MAAAQQQKEEQEEFNKEQTNQEHRENSLSNAQQQKRQGECSDEGAGKNVATTESHRLQSIEATIIDIPPASPTTKPPPPRFSVSLPTPLPSPSLSSSTSPSISSCYDTDSSSTSGTCRAHYSEHIYMQRPAQQQQHQQCVQPQSPQQFQQQQQQRQLQVFCKHTRETDVEADTEADIELVRFKDEQAKSWPFFLLMISILEIAVFVFDYVTVKSQAEQMIPIPTDSVLIYRPDRRQQLWRFVSYMVLHANWFHLSFNVVVQLLFGIPLEVVHGSARIAVIYFAGVFAGSLGTSVVDSEVYLVGASGGVYALLAAHLANLALNFGQMKSAVSQLVSVLIFASCDLGYTFYTQCLDTGRFRDVPAVSYISHLTGSLAGLTIGLLVLRNFEQRSHANLIWWLALGVYTAFTIFAIAFNLINTVTAQMIEEESEVITQHLLQDLGVS